jgi:hypothetical protein
LLPGFATPPMGGLGFDLSAAHGNHSSNTSERSRQTAYRDRHNLSSGLNDPVTSSDLSQWEMVSKHRTMASDYSGFHIPQAARMPREPQMEYVNRASEGALERMDECRSSTTYLRKESEEVLGRSTTYMHCQRYSNRSSPINSRTIGRDFIAS